MKSGPVRKLSEQELADIAASFQAACIDVVVEKLGRAATRIGVSTAAEGRSVVMDMRLLLFVRAGLRACVRAGHRSEAGRAVGAVEPRPAGAERHGATCYRGRRRKLVKLVGCLPSID